MSYKLYANNRCVVEIMDKLSELELASPNELREKAGHAKVNPKEKKICNCPNCGAPVTSYICEYCGTELEKPKKVLTNEEKCESLVNFVHEQNLAQMYASQDWQTRQILNTLNTYSVQSQIANIRDSINTHMLQTCNFKDSMMAYHSSINVSPYQGPKEEFRPQEEKKTKSADEELVEGLMFFMIGMLIFTIFCIVVTVIYNL